MKNTPILIATVLGSILLVLGIALAFGGQTGQELAQDEKVVIDQAVLLEGARHSKGASAQEATVTIVEFSDFQCPACRAAQPLLAGLIEDNPEQVRLVYRHLPLDTIHPFARLSAQASEVAAAQDSFWEFHDLLFQEQSTWAQLNSRNAVIDTFGEYFTQLELDNTDFSERINQPEVVAAVASDADLARELRVASTPTFFVNGVQATASELAVLVGSELQAAASATQSAEVEE